MSFTLHTDITTAGVNDKLKTNVVQPHYYCKAVPCMKKRVLESDGCLGFFDFFQSKINAHIDGVGRFFFVDSKIARLDEALCLLDQRPDLVVMHFLMQRLSHTHEC
jgi:hypothetical protein